MKNYRSCRKISAKIKESQISSGIVTVFVSGSTGTYVKIASSSENPYAHDYKV